MPDYYCSFSPIFPSNASRPFWKYMIVIPTPPNTMVLKLSSSLPLSTSNSTPEAQSNYGRGLFQGGWMGTPSRDQYPAPLGSLESTPRRTQAKQPLAEPEPSGWLCEGRRNQRERSWNSEYELQLAKCRYLANAEDLAKLEEESRFIKWHGLFSYSPEEYQRQGKRARARGIQTWADPTRETMTKQEVPVRRSAASAVNPPQGKASKSTKPSISDEASEESEAEVFLAKVASRPSRDPPQSQKKPSPPPPSSEPKQTKGIASRLLMDDIMAGFGRSTIPRSSQKQVPAASPPLSAALNAFGTSPTAQSTHHRSLIVIAGRKPATKPTAPASVVGTGRQVAASPSSRARRLRTAGHRAACSSGFP
ncbi:hypothetical protein M407DRAFT_18968 [Tulasnella calospora MUT 4182]|uniref:Uncharacterized protein n=1 Tax=Tulasnella calospora MUT 4182 TaxID=1051891 RepID=A0A0C3QUL2_9AGAM|nr:hypothetical protein M407DRAFT_18968 [Tulasnella calospora MUT 4182]